MGTPRISTVIKVGAHTDRNRAMEDKVQSARDKLGDPSRSLS
jgi:uncharacterized protein YqgV (UPF0045/DUF77 family)